MSIVRCISCDALSDQPRQTKKGFSTYCPCCQDKLAKAGDLTLSGELAITIAAIMIFVPAQYFSLVTINLLGVNISTTVSSGAWPLFDHFPVVAFLVVFCVLFAPLGYLLGILLAHFALYQRSAKMLHIATTMIKELRHWVMLDVFLVSLGIACFKVIDVAPLEVGQGLICFVLLHLTITLLLSRLSVKHYWDTLYPPEQFSHGLKATVPEQTMACSHCSLIQSNQRNACLRCHQSISPRKQQSLQKAWACLISAVIFIFPANFYPISILLQNGNMSEDTIISGVIKLINSGMYGIAAIIFSASILVPVAKIIGLAYILCCIHFNSKRNFLFRAKLYRFVHVIGKWSMMDLFVLTIMHSVIARDNLLGFTPGLAATAFGLVVVFTMLAANYLDPRLIWDTETPTNLAGYHRQEIKQ